MYKIHVAVSFQNGWDTCVQIILAGCAFLLFDLAKNFAVCVQKGRPLFLSGLKSMAAASVKILIACYFLSMEDHVLRMSMPLVHMMVCMPLVHIASMFLVHIVSMSLVHMMVCIPLACMPLVHTLI